MKNTLTKNEIIAIVSDTVKKMEAIKGTSSSPLIKMDLSIYTSETLEAIKEAFVAAGIRFEDRWNNGSDFVVPIDIKCAPSNLGRGRRDAFTRSDGPICEPGQTKKPSLADQIQSASNLAGNFHSTSDMRGKAPEPER